MDLKARLGALASESGGIPAWPAPDAPPLPLPVRLQRAGRRPRDGAVARRLGGERAADGLVVMEKRIPLEARHGGAPLADLLAAPLGMLVRGDYIAADKLLFLDTETTGLAGGTGTVAFLVGMARIDGGCLHLRQLLLTGFRGEAALLDLALDWISTAEALVTFNGKSFDLPLLVTRYRLARFADPFTTCGHLDLLHPIRCAFRRGWPDCRLQTAERRLLEFSRADDLPGWLVPGAWFDFVREGDFSRIPAVLDHNAWDTISLAGLCAALARVYDAGHSEADCAAIARALLRSGQRDAAHRHLSRFRESGDREGLLALADFCRRESRKDEAVALWEQLAAEGCLAALERLAKHFEHDARDYARALAAAEALLARAPGSGHEKRRARLLARLAACADSRLNYAKSANGPV